MCRLCTCRVLPLRSGSVLRQDQIRKLPTRGRFTDPGLNAGLSTSLNCRPARMRANGVYGYDFTYQNAPYYFPRCRIHRMPTGNFQALASHTIDIQFVFDNWHGGQLGVNLDQTSGQPRELQGARLPCLTSWWRRGRTSRRPAIRTERDFPCGRCSQRARRRSSSRTSPTRPKPKRSIEPLINVTSGIR